MIDQEPIEVATRMAAVLMLLMIAVLLLIPVLTIWASALDHVEIPIQPEELSHGK